jgi:hypothetical protein
MHPEHPPPAKMPILTRGNCAKDGTNVTMACEFGGSTTTHHTDVAAADTEPR